MDNDTYGQITRDELAALRAEAKPCLTCGMLATVDPVFHEARYAHTPRIADGAAVLAWSTAAFTWTSR
jgi:hypothetical protein